MISTAGRPRRVSALKGILQRLCPRCRSKGFTIRFMLISCPLGCRLAVACSPVENRKLTHRTLGRISVLRLLGLLPISRERSFLRVPHSFPEDSVKIEKRPYPEPGTVSWMLQRCFAILFGLVPFSGADSLWAQSDRGVITGTLTTRAQQQLPMPP